MRFAKNLQRLIACFVFAVATCQIADAGTVLGTGGATELTQIANNVQLVVSTVNQAKQIEEAITTRIAAVQQALDSLKNLKRFDKLLLDPSLSAFQSELSGLTQVYSSVMALGQSAASVQTLITDRLAQASAAGLDIKTFLTKESELATKRGGVFQKRIDGDIAAIQDMASKSANLGLVISKTADVTGNIQGLQQLAQISSISAGELLEVKSLLLAQQLDKDVASKDKAADDKAFSTAMTEAAAQAQARKARNAQITVDVRSPWAP